MSHWMFNCKEISKKVSISMDKSIPVHERMMIAFHLMMCKYCRRFKKQMLILRKALRLVESSREETDQSISLPLERRERIKQTIKDTSSDLI